MTADDFSKNAAECREQANKAADPGHKAQWVQLADAWLRMAEAAHSRPDAFDAK